MKETDRTAESCASARCDNVSKFNLWKALWLLCCTHTFDPLAFSGEADDNKEESSGDGRREADGSELRC